MMNYVTQESHHRAIKLKLSGMNYEQVGKELGVSRQRAQQLCRPTEGVRRDIRLRSNHMCERCTQPVDCGHIHHVTEEGKTVDTYNASGNLEYLCTPCHQHHHSNFKRGRSALTIEKVRQMKTLFDKEISISELAKMYSVSRRTISNIKEGLVWVSVKSPEDKQ